MSKEKITIDDLARLVVENHMEMKKEFSQEIGKLGNRLTRVEQGQEDIKLRLDNVEYRFELNDLNKRVTVLEKKVSFSK
jgi:predicted  nucleic acid-binding Zn-ribbon protein